MPSLELPNFDCQHKSSLKLYRKGRSYFKKIKFLENFHSHNNNSSYSHTDYCDPKNQERREDFWLHLLHTLYPKDLNHKGIN